MQRRSFLQASAAAAALPSGAALAAPPAKTGGKVLMKVGTQNGHDEANLKILSCFGVKNICSGLPSEKFDENWSVEGLSRLKDSVEKHGISLDMVPIPLSSKYITKVEFPNILMGKSPQRDREIEWIQKMIQNAAKAGIPSLKYNMSILGVVRSEPTPGRGISQYSTFVYEKAKQEPPVIEIGPVPADLYWERITYFLERVIPVANEHKIKMACHPHDPGMPKGKGFQGVETVLGSVDGLEKFLAIKESPYHGLNFCQGTVSEMLQDPGKEIFDVIRHFGSRKKIFNVHFRNIKGKFGNFVETFPDNGDVNMLKAIRVYQEVGYDGMLMPDHVPKIPMPEGSQLGFCFAYGYIQAAIQMLRNEVEA